MKEAGEVGGGSTDISGEGIDMVLVEPKERLQSISTGKEAMELVQ